MSSIKVQIQNRSLWTFGFMALIAIIIVCGILRIQNNEELVNKKVEDNLIYEKEIPAMRGNIYASDGKSLLATSVPYYYVGLDVKQAREDMFNKNIDELSRKLSYHFKDKTWNEYKALISQKRKSKNGRYLRLASRRISHQEKMSIKEFPLFKEGPNKGGGVFEKVSTRSMPFNDMAKRTIGSLDRDTKTKGLFGIEFSYNNYLAGKNGRSLFKRLAGGVNQPLDSEINVEAVPGLDVVTTLDVNFQDIVESALREKVIQTNANYGTAIVMEIATGEIKALANLSRRTRNDETEYLEDMNYAVLASTDPGSTFKLASMMAILEKGNMKLNDWAANCTGTIMHRGKKFTCDHEHGNINVGQVFEKSCNIGVYKLIEKVFGANGIDDYLGYISNYRLDKPIGFQLKGEKNPYFKNANDKTYSQFTLPWMSIGYESAIAPIQMLAFYNAVANNGYWVEPFLVREIKEGNTQVDNYDNVKIGKRLASADVIEMAQAMMKGVVTDGTAQGISKGFCQVAGKTGTAQKLDKNGYSKGRYFTSFIGYFPADNPKYTATIVIDEPRGDQVYAASVCAPVFRDIADKIFAYDVAIHPASHNKAEPKLLARRQKSGMAEDFQQIAGELSIKMVEPENGMVKLAITPNDSIYWKPIKETDGLPDVSGMTLKDALPLLENRGYSVRHKGFGKVTDYALVSSGLVSLVLK
jgi:cell division protein FtsI (penicillin-binding protein 3)